MPWYLFKSFQYDRTAVFYVMILPIAGIATTLNLLFFLFFFGEILHTNLIDLGQMVYQSEWYRYPLCTQRFVLIMIMRAQHSFHVSAYGIVRCNLENFVGVSGVVYVEISRIYFSAIYLCVNSRCWDQFPRLSWYCGASNNSENIIRFGLSWKSDRYHRTIVCNSGTAASDLLR